MVLSHVNKQSGFVAEVSVPPAAAEKRKYDGFVFTSKPNHLLEPAGVVASTRKISRSRERVRVRTRSRTIKTRFARLIQI